MTIAAKETRRLAQLSTDRRNGELSMEQLDTVVGGANFSLSDFGSGTMGGGGHLPSLSEVWYVLSSQK